MDYIRYVDVILPEGLQPKYGLVQDHVFPEFDYGYHPYMRRLYTEKTGVDPIQLQDAGQNEAWLQFRLDQLNQAVEALADQIRRLRMIPTAAVFPTPKLARDMVRQEWNKWGLDCYFPMVYFNFYNQSFDWVTQVVQEGKQASPYSLLFCGLYLPALQKDDDLTKAVEAAFSGGANGIAFFDLHALTPSIIQQIKQICSKKKPQTD